MFKLVLLTDCARSGRGEPQWEEAQLWEEEKGNPQKSKGRKTLEVNKEVRTVHKIH